MNLKLTKNIMTIAALVGFFPLVHPARATMMIGSKDPDTYVPPNSASLNAFLNKDRNGITTADMNSFTCGTVHPCMVAGSDAATVAAPLSLTVAGAAPKTVQAPSQARSIVTLDPAVMNQDPSSPMAKKSPTFPCPTGYAVTQLFAQTGDASCEMDQTDVNTGNIVASKLNVDPNGNGYVYTQKIGDGGSCGDDGCDFTFGLITQTVLGSNQQPLGPVTYNNYFLGQLSDATTLAQVECNLGNAVTYVSPSGPSASGYQVQVVMGNTDQNSTDKTYIPAGDTNLCLTKFLPNNN